MTSKSNPLNKRRRFLVDRPFQFKYTSYFLLAAEIPMLILCVIFYAVLNQRIKSEHVTHFQSSADTLLATQHELLWIFGGIFVFALIYLLVLTVVGFWVTHKIAGPIYAIRRDIEHMIATKTYHPFQIRRKDEFHGLKDDLNKLIQQITEKKP